MKKRAAVALHDDRSGFVIDFALVLSELAQIQGALTLFGLNDSGAASELTEIVEKTQRLARSIDFIDISHNLRAIVAGF